MTIQRVELRGERYVILPEQEFIEMQQKLPVAPPVQASSPGPGIARFREVIPLRTDGIPASELLIRDRR